MKKNPIFSTLSFFLLFLVLACVNKSGQSIVDNPNETFLLAEVPSMPTEVTVKDINYNSAVISWIAPYFAGIDQDGKVSKVSKYELDYSTSLSFNDAKTLTVTDTSQELTDLSPNTSYYVRIRVFNESRVNNVSENTLLTSPKSYFRTVELLPLGIPEKVTPIFNPDDSTLVNINWEEPTSVGFLNPEGNLPTIIGYVVEYTIDENFTSIISSVDVEDTKLELSNLTPATIYYFRIKSKNSNGKQSDFANISFSTRDLAVPPTAEITSLNANAVSSSEVDLVWTKPPSNSDFGKSADGSPASANGYFVYVSTSNAFDSNDTDETRIIDNDILSYRFDNLSPFTTYYFRVAVVNTDSNTAQSSLETSSTTMSAVSESNAPTGLTLDTTGTLTKNQIPLSWTAPTDAGLTPTGTASTIKDYIVEYKLSTDPDTSYAVFATRPAITSTTVTGLSPFEEYTFRVKAVNSDDQESIYSTTHNERTVSAAEAPESPTNVQAQLPSTWTDTNQDRYHKVNISWTAPTDTGKADNGTAVAIIDHYEVSWKKSSDPVDGSFDPTAEQYTKFNVEPLGNATSQDFTLGNIADFAGRTFVFQIKAVTASLINKTSIASTPSNPYQLLDRIKTIDYDVRKGLGSSSTTITFTGKDVNGNDTTVSQQQSFVTKDRINTGTISLVNSPTVTETALQSISKIVSVISSYGGTTAILSLEIEYLSGLKRTYQERKVIPSRGTSTYTYDIPTTP